MSGRDALNDRPSDAALAAALRALPDAAPMPDLWPELSRSLDARRRRPWRYALPVALAAGIALALVLPKLAHRDAAPSQPVAPVANVSAPSNDVDELSQLHKRSQSLERWIAAVAARAPQDGRDLMAAVEVEDLIGLIDVQLGGARTDSDALPLWRQRVALLEDLAAIRGNGVALAANG
ncbi:MAG TPA: hypothetical protein VFL30_01715, partial [Rhodanobacteraceae bacterium]|nr:hypothetical protein [Rhodanobacteraceae bacterium]